MKPFLILGASSFGRLIETVIQSCGGSVSGFIDDIHTGPRILGNRQYLFDELKADDFHLAMAIGYKHLSSRVELFQEARARNYRFPALVHPNALVSPYSEIAEGCVLMARSNVDAFSILEPLCVLWPGATISHDSRIGKNTFVSPNATLCGFVNVGESSFIGAASVVVDGSTLPTGTFVKAGSRYTDKKRNNEN